MPNAALFVSPGPLVDGSGNPYAASKLNFYTTGTSTRLNTYSDSGLLSANANPVVADINGKFGPIYLLANTSYKVVFATSADVTIWTWDPVQGISISATPSVGLLRSYLSGLGLSRNVGTPNTKIDVAVGACSDSTNVLAMSVSAGTIDCGTVGVNGLDAGILVLSTWYHVFAIAKVDGTVGLLASTSASSPALPSGYTLFRRIGSVKTDASVHFLAFTQVGDSFIWAAVVAETRSAGTFSLVGVPPGVIVEAMMTAYIAASAGAYSLTYTSSVQPGVPTSTLISGFGNTQASGSFRLFTPTNAQAIETTSGASITSVILNTLGWIDRRGRDA